MSRRGRSIAQVCLTLLTVLGQVCRLRPTPLSQEKKIIKDMHWRFPTRTPVITQIRISQLENQQIGKAPSFLFQAGFPDLQRARPWRNLQHRQHGHVGVSGGTVDSFNIFETQRKFQGRSLRRYGKRFYFIRLDVLSLHW